MRFLLTINPGHLHIEAYERPLPVTDSKNCLSCILKQSDSNDPRMRCREHSYLDILPSRTPRQPLPPIPPR